MSNTTATNRSTHIAYSVREYQQSGETKSGWAPIGVAWADRDGEGFDIVLESLPVNGRVALRRRKAWPAQAKRS